jgi:hypothetical protein
MLGTLNGSNHTVWHITVSRHSRGDHQPPPCRSQRDDWCIRRRWIEWIEWRIRGGWVQALLGEAGGSGGVGEDDGSTFKKVQVDRGGLTVGGIGGTVSTRFEMPTALAIQLCHPNCGLIYLRHQDGKDQHDRASISPHRD